MISKALFHYHFFLYLLGPSFPSSSSGPSGSFDPWQVAQPATMAQIRDLQVCTIIFHHFYHHFCITTFTTPPNRSSARRTLCGCGSSSIVPSTGWSSARDTTPTSTVCTSRRDWDKHRYKSYHCCMVKNIVPFLYLSHQATFDIALRSCGMSSSVNDGYASPTPQGSFIENTIIIQVRGQMYMSVFKTWQF